MKKISIVGVEGSGKTVLMSVLGEKYAVPDENGLLLKAKKGETFAFCMSNVAAMRKGEWPNATLPGEMSRLEWQLLHHKKSSSPEVLGDVTLLDFAGEVYRQAFGMHKVEEAYVEDVEMLRNHVSRSDVLVVLVNLKDVIDADRTDQRTIDMLWLSQAICDFANSHGVKDMAIALSQSDRYEGIVVSCGGIENTFRKHLSHVAYTFPEMPVFAVSAVDGNVLENGRIVPAEDFKSKGLSDLMRWIQSCIAPANRKLKKVLYFLGILIFLTVVGYCLHYIKQNNFSRSEEISRMPSTEMTNTPERRKQSTEAATPQKKEPATEEEQHDVWNPDLIKKNRTASEPKEKRLVKIECPRCDGKGIIEKSGNCSVCNGLRMVDGKVNCHFCDGRGVLKTLTLCKSCNGMRTRFQPCSAGCQRYTIEYAGVDLYGKQCPCNRNPYCIQCFGGGILICKSCGGTGQRAEPCRTCSGMGNQYDDVNCNLCQGTKKVDGHVFCSACKGTGSVRQTVRCDNVDCENGIVWKAESHDDIAKAFAKAFIDGDVESLSRLMFDWELHKESVKRELQIWGDKYKGKKIEVRIERWGGGDRRFAKEKAGETAEAYDTSLWENGERLTGGPDVVVKLVDGKLRASIVNLQRWER